MRRRGARKGVGGFVRVYSAGGTPNKQKGRRPTPDNRTSPGMFAPTRGRTDLNPTKAAPCRVRRGDVADPYVRPGLIISRCEAIPTEPIAYSLARSLAYARSYDPSNSRAYPHIDKHVYPKSTTRISSFSVRFNFYILKTGHA